jgi:hypothetical protein
MTREQLIDTVERRIAAIHEAREAKAYYLSKLPDPTDLTQKEQSRLDALQYSIDLRLLDWQYTRSRLLSLLHVD